MDFKKFLLNELEGTQSGNFFYDFLNYKNDFSEQDVTVKTLEQMKEYALERVSPNSAKTYLSYFKQAFYKAERSGYKFPIRYDDVQKYLFVQKEASENIFLTREEIAMLEKYTPPPFAKTEIFTRAVFLLSCYTGIRVSDYPLITAANFENGELMYTANKTKQSARMPLHPLVPELIGTLNEFNYPMPIAAAMVAQYIKIIFSKLGIDRETTLYQAGKRQTQPRFRFVSAHTARRSFATNLYLDGYDMKQIAVMMGHANTTQTERYIVSSFSDDIAGSKTYLFPNKKTNDSSEKIEAARKMLAELGINSIEQIEQLIQK